MGANLQVVFLRLCDRLAHGFRGTGVAAAGDVDRGEVLEERFLGAVGNVFGNLAYVSVDVDHSRLRRFSWRRRAVWASWLVTNWNRIWSRGRSWAVLGMSAVMTFAILG